MNLHQATVSVQSATLAQKGIRIHDLHRRPRCSLPTAAASGPNGPRTTGWVGNGTTGSILRLHVVRPQIWQIGQSPMHHTVGSKRRHVGRQNFQWLLQCRSCSEELIRRSQKHERGIDSDSMEPLAQLSSSFDLRSGNQGRPN